jgi:L-iditol 2-dehydrogenase
MSTTTTISKSNIGVFTNPAHELWVAESEPSLDIVKKGEGLKEGEVTIGVRSTGICGFTSLS